LRCSRQARSCGAIAVEWLDGAQTCILVSRLASRSLAAKLWRHVQTCTMRVLAFLIVLCAGATSCSSDFVAAGPLAELASEQLGATRRCGRDSIVRACEARRGDTLVTVILDSLARPISVLRSWRASDSLSSYRHLADSLSGAWGTGIPCDQNGDLPSLAGRAWVRPPLVHELRFGEKGQSGLLLLKSRWTAHPNCQAGNI